MPPPICPAVRIFGLLSKRWMLLILHAIFGGTQTFNALKRQLGSVSSRTLAARLRELEQEGFIQRIVRDRPLHIEYHPTHKSHAIHVHLEAIGVWAQQHDA